MPDTKRDDNFYRQAGFNAYRLGLTAFDNPYPLADSRNKLWLEGYVDAKRKRAKPMEVSEKDKAVSQSNIAHSSPTRPPRVRIFRVGNRDHYEFNPKPRKSFRRQA